jgi:tetratricopeptide (TPR) repeat protein
LRHNSFHLVQRAWAAYQAKRYDLAEKEARGALALEPNDPEALSVLSLCAMQRNDRPSAVQLAQQAIGRAADWPIYHYRLALVHGHFADHKAAETPLRTTLELDPSFAPAYSLFAWVYFARGHVNIALRAIDEALQYDPHDVYALNLRIELLQSRGDHEAAQRAAMEALRVNPENEQAHALAGVSTLKLKDPNRGVFHLQEAVRLDPHKQWVRKAYVQALESQHPIARPLLKLQHWTASSLDGHGAFWLLLWAIYFLARYFAGAPLGWHFVPATAAATFLVLLAVTWWGGVAPYFLMRSQPEIHRLIAAQQSLWSRLRIATPGQIALTTAVILSFASFVMASSYILPIATAVLFNAISLLCCEAARSRRAKIATGIYAAFVFLGSIAWAVSLIQQRPDVNGAIVAIAVFSYFVLIHFEKPSEFSG